MRFVKATERLPEKFVDVIVRNTRTGRVRKEQNMGFDYAFGAGDHDFEFKETEWLDEQDEGWVPVEQFADFLDTERNKGLDGRGKESLWNDMKIWGKTTAFKLMLEKFKDRQSPATT